MASVNDVGVPGQPLGTPPLTEWQKAVRDVLGSSDVVVTRPQIAHVVKTSDQASIASGGSAGLTATLTGVRVGQLVVGLISTVYKPTTGAVPAVGYVNPVASGLTAITAPVPPFGFTAINSTWNGLSVVTYTAAAATASLGYSMTFSSNATWTCQSQSSVTLIAL